MMIILFTSPKGARVYTYQPLENPSNVSSPMQCNNGACISLKQPRIRSDPLALPQSQETLPTAVAKCYLLIPKTGEVKGHRRFELTTTAIPKQSEASPGTATTMPCGQRIVGDIYVRVHGRWEMSLNV